MENMEIVFKILLLLFLLIAIVAFYISKRSRNNVFISIVTTIVCVVMLLLTIGDAIFINSKNDNDNNEMDSSSIQTIKEGEKQTTNTKNNWDTKK